MCTIWTAGLFILMGYFYTVVFVLLLKRRIWTLLQGSGGGGGAADQICCVSIMQQNIPEFLIPRTIRTHFCLVNNDPRGHESRSRDPAMGSLWLGHECGRAPSLSLRWQLNGKHHTRGRQAGREGGGEVAVNPSVTVAPPSHHPSGTLTQRWQSAACDVVRGPVYSLETH